MGKATFEIVLENSIGVPGSHLKGALFVEVQQELSGTKLTINFSGVESTKVRYTSGKHSHFAYGSRNLVSYALPVDSSSFLQGNSVVPGHYKIPFELELPELLPSSMEHQGQGGYCRIRYTVEAKLEGSGTLWDYKCSQNVMVRAKPLDLVPLPFNKVPYTEQVSFCCCLGRGFIAFGAMVDDTRLARGDTLTVNMSLRNHTVSRIQSIDAVLIEHITWSAGGHRSSMSQELVRTSFERVQGLERDGQSASLTSQEDLTEILKEMRQGINVRRVQIPTMASPSFQGSFIKVSHTLQVVVRMGLCYTNPTIIIPLQIGEPITASVPAPFLQTSQQEYCAIPSIFSADTTTVANTIRIPSSHAIFGGPAISQETGEVAVMTPAAMTNNELTPSLTNLLKAMQESIDSASLIESKASEPSWKRVFDSIQPPDFKEMLKKVDSEFDEPAVAESIAQHVGKFTCAYVVAALEVVSDGNRSNVVERLVPYCTDLGANQEAIKRVLSEWETLVTQSAFDKVLK